MPAYSSSAAVLSMRCSKMARVCYGSVSTFVCNFYCNWLYFEMSLDERLRRVAREHLMDVDVHDTNYAAVASVLW